MTDEVRAHVKVTGRVQGVFFRATLAEEARHRNVAGWVRNRPDGQVEAVFEGERVLVEELVRICHEGPPMAQVEQAEVSWDSPEGISGFRIR